METVHIRRTSLYGNEGNQQPDIKRWKLSCGRCNEIHNGYMRLYHESKQDEKPLALQNFVFGNSRMYDMLDRVGNLQEKVK